MAVSLTTLRRFGLLGAALLLLGGTLVACGGSKSSGGGTTPPGADAATYKQFGRVAFDRYSLLIDGKRQVI